MSTRTSYGLGFILIGFLLSVSFYLQIYAGIMPCPLCTLQRLTFALLGILFLIGLLSYKNVISRLILNLFLPLISALGIFLAGRQIWLQHFNSGAGECGVSLQYMLQVLPLQEVMQKIFAGSAECTQRGWEFLSLNMAEWAFIWFILFFIYSLWVAFKKK